MLPTRTGRSETVTRPEAASVGEAVPAPGRRPFRYAFLFEMKHRLLRVNELVKRELSRLITRDVSFDSALVTISQVDVTPDLKSAHVFISVLGAESKTSV